MRTPAKKFQIKDTLTAYLKQEQLTIYKLEKACKFSNGYFHTVRYNLPIKRIQTILEVLPNLNGTYLLTGTGEMTNGLSGYEFTPFVNTFSDKKIVVSAEITKDIHNLLHVKSAPLPMPSEFKFGDKVKIIILKDETPDD